MAEEEKEVHPLLKIEGFSPLRNALLDHFKNVIEPACAKLIESLQPEVQSLIDRIDHETNRIPMCGETEATDLITTALATDEGNVFDGVLGGKNKYYYLNLFMEQKLIDPLNMRKESLEKMLEIFGERKEQDAERLEKICKNFELILENLHTDDEIDLEMEDLELEEEKKESKKLSKKSKTSKKSLTLSQAGTE